MKKQFYDRHCIFNMINYKKIKIKCTSDINVFKYNRLLHIKLDLNYVNQMKLNLTSSPRKMCVLTPLPSTKKCNHRRNRKDKQNISFLKTCTYAII